MPFTRKKITQTTFLGTRRFCDRNDTFLCGLVEKEKGYLFVCLLVYYLAANTLTLELQVYDKGGSCVMCNVGEINIVRITYKIKK